MSTTVPAWSPKAGCEDCKVDNISNSFKFQVTHIKGKEKIVTISDCLSHLFEESPDSQNTSGNKVPETAPGPYTEPKCFISFNIPKAFNDITERQAQDPKLNKIIKSIQAGHSPDNYDLLNRVLLHQISAQSKPRIEISERLIHILF